MTWDVVARAEKVAREAHQGQVDKGGEPYIGHVERVAKRLADAGHPDHVVAAAWLHDVVEDTKLTFGELFSFGFDHDVVELVTLLTRLEYADDTKEPYGNYLWTLMQDPEARAIKQADLADNLDLNRVLPEANQGLRKRYVKAQVLLQTADELGIDTHG